MSFKAYLQCLHNFLLFKGSFILIPLPLLPSTCYVRQARAYPKISSLWKLYTTDGIIEIKGMKENQKDFDGY